jgi:uncharacterized NAD(P)/FAD-binding protein YdhS
MSENRVVIAGSGVAAVEAVLALRHLAGRDFHIDLSSRAASPPSRRMRPRRSSPAARPPVLDLYD